MNRIKKMASPSEILLILSEKSCKEKTVPVNYAL
jgi:hypothetical protein